MKYLLLDHIGVLTQAFTPLGELNEAVIEALVTLTEKYGYQVAFHSSHHLEGQLELLEKLKMKSLEKNLIFPKVQALAVRDAHHPDIRSDNPIIKDYKDGLKIATFGIKKSGKTDIREALSYILNIDKAARHNSVVFDDQKDHIIQAKKEGYHVKHIHAELTLEGALQEILRKIE